MTNAELANRVPGLDLAGRAAEAARAGGWPLTPFQRSMLLRWLSAPRAGHYVQQLLWRDIRHLDLDRARRAWEFMAARRDALRLRFQWDGVPEPRQFVEERVDVEFAVIRCEEGGCPETSFERFLSEDRVRGHELDKAPVWRVTVFESAPEVWRMVWTFHHALLDGRSHALVFEEWRAVYQGLDSGAAPPLGPLVSYRDFLEALARRPVDEGMGYWKRRLSGFPGAPGLPTLTLDPDEGADDGENVEATECLEEEETARLREAATRHGVTLNNLVQGAWALMLARTQSVDDVTFGTVRAGGVGRPSGDEPSVPRVGLFVDTVPFRVEARAETPLGPWLQGIRDQQRELRGSEYVTREDMRRAAGVSRGVAVPDGPHV